ncbi:hypothetical protein O6P43_025828 [Quillaja saponaria]|uniref:Uncharacterized protein n=1 Tax=Quillaja saponaria TaxID=32244 RepID=A0AAD7PGN5_QUISA|nr:hypothetical protein O6P43_025828 [Quillaja saponaria]
MHFKSCTGILFWYRHLLLFQGHLKPFQELNWHSLSVSASPSIPVMASPSLGFSLLTYSFFGIIYSRDLGSLCIMLSTLASSSILTFSFGQPSSSVP